MRYDGPCSTNWKHEIRISNSSRQTKPEANLALQNPRLVRKGRLVLTWILRDKAWACVLNSFGSQKELASVSCEHGNEYLGFVKCVKFLAQPSDYRLLNKKSTGVTESLQKD